MQWQQIDFKRKTVSEKGLKPHSYVEDFSNETFEVKLKDKQQVKDEGENKTARINTLYYDIQIKGHFVNIVLNKLNEFKCT